MRWQRTLRRKMVTEQMVITLIPWLLTIDELVLLIETSRAVTLNVSSLITELISSFILLPSTSVMKTKEKTV